MTDDDKALVKRLKGHSQIMERDKGKFLRFIDVATCTEAADRIEALSAENERLREALRNLVVHCHEQERELTEELRHMTYCGESLPLCNARAALEQKQ